MMTNLKETILEKIKDNEVQMKPRAYFTLRLAALLALVAVILGVTVFLFNFIFFTIRISGHMHLFSYGLPGAFVFLSVFPWTLLLVDIVLLLLLEYLLRRFRFAYRRPVLHILLVLLALSISVGLFIDRTSDWNERALHRADRDSLPGVLNDFYRGARRLPPPEYRLPGINVPPPGIGTSSRPLP